MILWNKTKNLTKKREIEDSTKCTNYFEYYSNFCKFAAKLYIK